MPAPWSPAPWSCTEIFSITASPSQRCVGDNAARWRGYCRDAPLFEIFFQQPELSMQEQSYLSCSPGGHGKNKENPALPCARARPAPVSVPHNIQISNSSQIPHNCIYHKNGKLKGHFTHLWCFFHGSVWFSVHSFHFSSSSLEHFCLHATDTCKYSLFWLAGLYCPYSKSSKGWNDLTTMINSKQANL